MTTGVQSLFFVCLSLSLSLYASLSLSLSLSLSISLSLSLYLSLYLSLFSPCLYLLISLILPLSVLHFLDSAFFAQSLFSYFLASLFSLLCWLRFVCKSEILRNMLYRGAEVMREVGWLIFDEVHYMRDKVWESFEKSLTECSDFVVCVCLLLLKAAFSRVFSYRPLLEYGFLKTCRSFHFIAMFLCLTFPFLSLSIYLSIFPCLSGARCRVGGDHHSASRQGALCLFVGHDSERHRIRPLDCQTAQAAVQCRVHRGTTLSNDDELQTNFTIFG
jgi:hypothetical protein